MSSSTTRYLARFELPELIERGRAEQIQCQVSQAGQLRSPTAGASSTVSVYDEDGTAVVAAAVVSVVSGVATYTIPALSTAGHDFARNWRVEWSLLMPDGVVHLFRNDGALVKYRLYPVISDVDIVRRMRALDTSLPGTITTRTNFGDVIDEADVELQLRLLEDEKRPNLIATPTALRMCWLNLAIAIVFEGLAGQNEAYVETAKSWRLRYEAAYSAASAQFDYDEDGVVDEGGDTAGRIGFKPSGIWTC